MLKIDEKCYHKEIAWLEKQDTQDDDSNILQRFSFYSYKDEPDVLYLAGVFVNEDCRNKGIGTKILKVADETASIMGCQTIRLKTQKDTDAYKLYIKNGYKVLTDEGNQVWLEKHGEQKPVVSDDALREGITHFGITQYQIDNWLKKYVEVEKLEQKPTDKVEQEYHCNGVREPKEATGVLKQLLNKENYVWSEEDENRFTNLISLVKCSKENDATKEGFIKFINRLKSIGPQSTWKPSEEQMDALETAISSLQSTALESLYNELKKL